MQALIVVLTVIMIVVQSHTSGFTPQNWNNNPEVTQQSIKQGPIRKINTANEDVVEAAIQTNTSEANDAEYVTAIQSYRYKQDQSAIIDSAAPNALPPETRSCSDLHEMCTNWALSGLCQLATRGDMRDTANSHNNHYRNFVRKSCCASCARLERLIDK